MRTQRKNYGIYLSGYASEGGVKDAAREHRKQIDNHGALKTHGSDLTTATQAMQDYAMAQLRFKKGTVQDVVRTNNYLYAGSRRHASNWPLSSGSPRNVCNKGTLLHSFCPKAFATHRSFRLRSDMWQTGHWLLRVKLQKAGN